MISGRIHIHSGLEIINTGQDMEWLKKHPDMLFPDKSNKAAQWFHIVQHRGQARYYKEHQLEILLLGRRKADGNYVGKDNIYTNSAGITRYSPLAEWRHEDILAYIHYYDVKLPPIEKTYGSMPDTAMMECINVLHQGGDSALRRILYKTSEPYTADKIYTTLCQDPADPTPNQVGDYTDRQKAVISMIWKYAMTAERKEDVTMTKTEKAIRQMETWAKDVSHGYDQDYRWGEKGDYDCSSAVIQAWQNAGVPVKSGGATYTGDMKNVFLKNGFVDVTSKVNVATGSGLLRGDVLLNEAHHVAMYCGNGKEVEASINEKGTAHGGKPGDQTGKEFLIRSYRNYPWNCVLRYRGNIFSASDTEKKQNTVAYVARFTKDCKCYSAAGKTQAKMFPVIKKNAVVDVMKYTETVKGKRWYFIRIPYPNDEGFVREFVPAGYFKKLI